MCLHIASTSVAVINNSLSGHKSDISWLSPFLLQTCKKLLLTFCWLPKLWALCCCLRRFSYEKVRLILKRIREQLFRVTLTSFHRSRTRKAGLQNMYALHMWSSCTQRLIETIGSCTRDFSLFARCVPARDACFSSILLQVACSVCFAPQQKGISVKNLSTAGNSWEKWNAICKENCSFWHRKNSALGATLC